MGRMLRLVQEASATATVSAAAAGRLREPVVARQLHTSDLLAVLPVMIGMSCIVFALLTAPSALAISAYLVGAAVAFAVAVNWARQVRDSPCLQDL